MVTITNIDLPITLKLIKMAKSCSKFDNSQCSNYIANYNQQKIFKVTFFQVVSKCI